jgi:2-C-methyl-D-erythritol 2,4-cyclodiphosphate synthase
VLGGVFLAAYEFLDPPVPEGDGRMTTPTSVGLGRDIHALVPGHKLVLGGVEIPSDRGSNTHSDGDVLSHALVDALAGAMSDGDLGTHYPENDPNAEDARSLEFVCEFAGYVRDHGYEILHVDSFVTLGPIRLRPHIAEMQRNVAEALRLPLSHVSVKARSNDGLGLEGEGKAASATAIVLLARTALPIDNGVA